MKMLFAAGPGRSSIAGRGAAAASR